VSDTVWTAQRLCDGAVVFLAERGWSERIDDAQVTNDAEAHRRRVESDPRVVDPYPIQVERSGERVVPVRRRERIRSRGPTVRPDLNRE
jgi:hypothetical protein